MACGDLELRGAARTFRLRAAWNSSTVRQISVSGPVLPVDRIGIRQRHGGDVGEDFVALYKVASSHVPTHPVRIGADDEQVVARAGVAMPVLAGRTRTSP